MVEYKDNKLYYDVTLDLECERTTPIIKTTGQEDNRYLRIVVTANGKKIKFDEAQMKEPYFLWISPQGKTWYSNTITWQTVTSGDEEYTQFLVSFTAKDYEPVSWRGRAEGFLGTNNINTQIMYIDRESYYHIKPDVDPTIVYGYNEIQTNAVTDEVREEEI